MIPHIQEKILAFFKKNPLAVISTIGEQSLKPEAALVAFAETEKLELLFETFSFARKNANLKKNNKVAFVIGWDTLIHITVQYEGIAQPIKNIHELTRYQELFLEKKTPCTKEYLYHPAARLYKVKPTWIRYSDYTVEPAEIFELSLDDFES